MQQGNKPEPKSWGARLREENRALRERIEALKKEERRLTKTISQRSKLIHELPEPVLILKKGKIMLANQAASEVFGYAPETMEDMDFSQLIHPTSKESLHLLARQSHARGPRESFLMDRTGCRLLCEIQTKKIRYEQGQTVVLLTVTALSHRREKEKDRCEILKREALSRAITSLSPVLERSGNHLRQGIAELKRTPAGQAQTRSLTEEQMAAAMNECDRMTRTLRLLVPSEYTPSETGPLSMEEMVKEAVARVEADGRPHHGVTVKPYVRSMDCVYGHRLHIQQALDHILLNAVEAMPDGGEIYLTTETHSGMGRIYIQDNGPGIPEAVLERIFDPFFTTKPEPAQGLGLSLAQAIVHKHRGVIRVSSLENGGTTVVMELPMGAPPASPRARNKKMGVKGARILLLAQEGVVSRLIRGMLEEKGAVLSAATTCTEAVHLIEHHHFHLIIADGKLPGLTGHRFILRIKRDASALPVLMFNAHAKSRQGRGATDPGPDRILKSPLFLDRILSATSALLDQKPV